jgi:hypothetical protein
MYAKVVQGGAVKSGDCIKVIGDAEINLEEVMVSNASNYALWPRTAEVTACDIGNNKTKLTLKTTSPWQPPKAQPGQRLKLHLGEKGWTQEYITAASEFSFEVEIGDSETEDPITDYLRKDIYIGKIINISGPYGRF